MQVLPRQEGGLARANLAQFLSEKVRRGSYPMALAIIEALKNETHLEVSRYLRAAFRTVIGVTLDNKLDGSDYIIWWQKESENSRANDPKSAKKP